MFRLRDSTFHLEHVREIAIPVVAGMGNGLMAQPMVRQLAAAFPNAQVIVLARNASIAGVFDRRDDIAEVRVYGNEPKQFARLLRDLRAMRADLCIVPYPSNRWQYSLLASRSLARRTIMHRYNVGRFKALHDLPGVERFSCTDGRHDVLSNLDLLRPLGIEPDETMVPVMEVSQNESQERRGEGEQASPRYCAIHAGSGATVFAMSKRWPPERYAELIPRLREDFGLTPILLEGPEDEGVGALMQRHVDVPVQKLRGSLHEAAAMLAACEIYVGSDSGLAHLAAAVGTPPVALFGPARPDEVCPFGYRHLVVQTPARCAPCFKYPQHATSPAVACRPPFCIGQIGVGAVLSTVAVALAEGS